MVPLSFLWAILQFLALIILIHTKRSILVGSDFHLLSGDSLSLSDFSTYLRTQFSLCEKNEGIVVAWLTGTLSFSRAWRMARGRLEGKERETYERERTMSPRLSERHCRGHRCPSRHTLCWLHPACARDRDYSILSFIHSPRLFSFFFSRSYIAARNKNRAGAA